MFYKHTIVVASLVGIGIIGVGFVPKTFSIVSSASDESQTLLSTATSVDFSLPQIIDATAEASSNSDVEHNKNSAVEATSKKNSQKKSVAKTTAAIYTVPFYSQFTDISAPEWKKVGCGIASLAMLVNFYKPESVTVDTLLKRGIAAGAYSDAGWSHAGLIALSHKYGLTGESHDFRDSTMEVAFEALKAELKNGPVMASVHYTFIPTNPIPHIVVINGVTNGKVYYNDPAEKGGNGVISIEKFEGAWKKRYISIRPV